MYDTTKGWAKKELFTPKCAKSGTSHYVKLFIEDGILFSCCWYDHKIHTWSLKGGPFHTIGKEGSAAGCFKNPLLCEIDNDLNMIVADYSNHRIQVVNTQGEGGVFNIGEKICYPRSTVVHKDKLIIVSTGSPYLMTVLSHE